MEKEKEKEQPQVDPRKVKRDKKWEIALGVELNASRQTSRLIALMSFLSLCFSAWLIMLSSLPPSKALFGCLLVASFLWLLSCTSSLFHLYEGQVSSSSLLDYAPPSSLQGLKAKLPLLSVSLFSLGMFFMFVAFIAARLYVNSSDPFA